MKKSLIFLLISTLLFCVSCNSVDVEQEHGSSNIISEESTAMQNSDSSASVSETKPIPPPEDYNFAMIRAKVPYEGLRLDREVFNIFSDEDFLDSDSERSPFIDDNDKIGKRIEQYVNVIEIGEKEILSRHELSAKDVTYPAIRVTTIYSSSPEYDNRHSYRSELEPIRAAKCYAVGYEFNFLFCLKEHVEENIRLLFGEDMVPEALPVDFGNIRYDETTGIYEYLPRGANMNLFTIVLDYEDLGDRYCVKVAYVLQNINVYEKPSTREDIYPQSDWDKKTGYEALKEYVQDSANQYNLYIVKQDDSLLFEKQVSVS